MIAVVGSIVSPARRRAGIASRLLSPLLRLDRRQRSAVSRGACGGGWLVGWWVGWPVGWWGKERERGGGREWGPNEVLGNGQTLNFSASASFSDGIRAAVFCLGLSERQHYARAAGRRHSSIAPDISPDWRKKGTQAWPLSPLSISSNKQSVRRKAWPRVVLFSLSLLLVHSETNRRGADAGLDHGKAMAAREQQCTAGGRGSRSLPQGGAGLAQRARGRLRRRAEATGLFWKERKREGERGREREG